MKPENQILILKALEAISLLSKTTATNVLLSPQTSMVIITKDIKTLKYKLSIIEGVLNQMITESLTKAAEQETK